MGDVRKAIEHFFIGHPFNAINTAWKAYPEMKLNEYLSKEEEEMIKDKSVPVSLLCRSSQ